MLRGLTTSLIVLLAVCASSAMAQTETPRIEILCYPDYKKIWKPKGDVWISKRQRIPSQEFEMLKDVIAKSRTVPEADARQFGLTPEWWKLNSGRMESVFSKHQGQVWEILKQQNLTFTYEDAINVWKDRVIACPQRDSWYVDVRIFDAVPIHLSSACPTRFKFPWQVEVGSDKWRSCDISIPKAIEIWLSKPSRLTRMDKWPDEIFDGAPDWYSLANKSILANSGSVSKSLPGWETANAEMRLDETTFHGQLGTVRPNLELRLSLRSPQKSDFKQVLWTNEYEQGKLMTTWNQLLAYCRESKAIAEEMGWISRWLSWSSARGMNLYVLNAGAGPSKIELEEAWKGSGIAGVPEYSFSLHEGEVPVAWVLVSKTQQRSVVFKFDESGGIIPISYRWKTFRGFMEVCDWKSMPKILLPDAKPVPSPGHK